MSQLTKLVKKGRKALGVPPITVGNVARVGAAVAAPQLAIAAGAVQKASSQYRATLKQGALKKGLDVVADVAASYGERRVNNAAVPPYVLGLVALGLFLIFRGSR